MIKQLLLLGVVASAYGRVPDHGTTSSIRDDRCPEAKGHHLIPHETDRDKFYLCQCGWRNAQPITCAPGTAFDYKLQVCDWLQYPRSQVLKSIDAGENDNDGDEWLANGCPKNFLIHWLLPHEADCNKFYSCVEGHKWELVCHPGLHFNADLQVCDWPVSAGCKSRGSGDEVAIVSASTNVERQEWLENGCPASSKVQWMLPHEKECSKFYLCINGEKIKLECKSGLHFNPVSQVCDWAWSAGCKAESGKSGVSTKVMAKSDVQTGEWLENGCPASSKVQWLLPHDTDCSSFYLCLSGEKVKRECPFGLHFNPVSQVCDWASSAGCKAQSGKSGVDTAVIAEEEWLPNGCPADPLVHWLLPHETDCTKFYSCVNGHKWVQDCHPGLHFNADLQVCDWISSAGCLKL